MGAYDVAVIGAGVTGAFVARELSRYDLKVAVMEAGADVCSGASRANSGVIHAGFFNASGTLKAETCVEGSLAYEGICAELGVPHVKCGKLVTVPKGMPRGRERLEALLGQGREVGTPDLRIIDRDEARDIEPNIECDAALVSPRSAVVSPYMVTIAAAEDAAVNGVDFFLNTEVTEFRSFSGGCRMTTRSGHEISASAIVNCAGVSSARVASALGLEGYTVHPSRGEYLLMDKSVGGLINGLVYPLVPEGETTLGVHLTPTVAGHILIGPTQEYVGLESTATTRERIDEMLRDVRKLLPTLGPEHIIKTYAGLRAKLVPEGGSDVYGDVDFVMVEEPEGVIHLLGIESPGLTAAPALAKRVTVRLTQLLTAGRKREIVPYRWRYSSHPTPEERAQAIAGEPSHGRILCRCENASQAEVRAAFENPLGAAGLNAIKYRTGAMMGRCQGGYCSPRIADMMISRGVGPGEIRLGRPGSEVFVGRVKEEVE